jgi:tRNA (guanosine-2'-O-)-methyltransferase
MDVGLYEYLRGYLSEARLARFEHILDNRTRHFTLVLEDIFHAPNAGAVIRTCECFGVQDIYVIENSKPFQLNTRVVRGSAKWTTLRRTDLSEQCMEALRGAGYRIAATTLREDKPLIFPEDIPVNEKVALCMGSVSVQPGAWRSL